jgi:hypothetical protein
MNDVCCFAHCNLFLFVLKNDKNTYRKIKKWARVKIKKALPISSEELFNIVHNIV